MSMHARNTIMIVAVIVVGITVLIFPPFGVISIPIGFMLKFILYPSSLQTMNCPKCNTENVIKGNPEFITCEGCSGTILVNNTAGKYNEVVCPKCKGECLVEGKPDEIICVYCNKQSHVSWG
ncbi:hypothetical protein WAG12_26160 [Bacillus cereus]|uniref:hypothetical protein n=1 Tax=Bacillus tropicus TaxID=2026188 RepID=UPI0013DF3A33|nr:hypothetical protein [Bacillus tropicus]QIE40473.1 hypothetical protein GM610_26915 [Bacillus tropicus]